MILKTIWEDGTTEFVEVIYAWFDHAEGTVEFEDLSDDTHPDGRPGTPEDPITGFEPFETCVLLNDRGLALEVMTR